MGDKHFEGMQQAYLIKGWLFAQSNQDAAILSAIDIVIAALTPITHEEAGETPSEIVRRLKASAPTLTDFNEWKSLEEKQKAVDELIDYGQLSEKYPNIGTPITVSQKDNKKISVSDFDENELQNDVISAKPLQAPQNDYKSVDYPDTHTRTGHDFLETDEDEKRLGLEYQRKLNEQEKESSNKKCFDLPSGTRMIFGKERVLLTEDQKREIVRRRDNNEKWPAIAKAMNMPEKKIYQFYYNYKDHLDRWRDPIPDRVDADGWPKPVKATGTLLTEKKPKPSLTVAKRIDTPADEIIERHQGYAGKRELGQELVDEDWPQIREMLKSFGNDYIAAQFNVTRTALDYFIAEQSAVGKTVAL